MPNENTAHVEMYKAYLEDLGRIGGRHENARKFYISVISALFVFLSMAGEEGVFANVQSWVFGVVGIVGILICLAWFDHMTSFGKLYFAKLETLRSLENELNVLKPFGTETTILMKPHEPTDSNKKKQEWRYRPLTVLDKVVPAACALLFAGLLVFKVIEQTVWFFSLRNR